MRGDLCCVGMIRVGLSLQAIFQCAPKATTCVVETQSYNDLLFALRAPCDLFYAPCPQLNALEAQLNEDPSCDVEGWLLLALHRLPRAGDSATAVLNTVGVSFELVACPYELGCVLCVCVSVLKFVGMIGTGRYQ